MRERRSSLAVIALLVALIAWPVVAHAGVQVVAPLGWTQRNNAAPEAQRRAERWRDALGLSMTQIVAAPDTDRFAETVAVFERTRPVSEEAFASEADAVRELTEAVAPIVGTAAPERTGLRQTAGGQVAWGRWTVDNLSYECVLAPSGGSTSIVVMAVLVSQAPELRETLDGIVETLAGVTPPMPAFSLTAWRVGPWVLWLALALGLHALMLAFVDRDADHREAGTRAAGINAVLVIAGTIAAFVVLGEREFAIVHAGSSIAGLLTWIGVSGIVVVGAHFLIATRFDRGQVRSAPMSGVYASGVYSTSDVYRAGGSRTKLRREDIAAASGTWQSTPSGVPQLSQDAESGEIDSDERPTTERRK